MNVPKVPFHWTLNESLLQDATTLTNIYREIPRFFLQNHADSKPPHDGVGSPLNIQYIRGILIKHGSWLKSDREWQIASLLEEIHSLEAVHKQSLAQATLAQLTILREKLQFLTLNKAKAALVKFRKF